MVGKGLIAVLPAHQLKQAQALVQDVQQFMREQTENRYHLFDYRMVDVFRGLTLAIHGLDALIEDKHYTEYEQMQEAMQNWPGMVDEPSEGE